MLVYAIGDIHGMLEPLTKVWEKIKADAGSKEHRIVTVGDYVDRGPDSKGVVDFLMKNCREGHDINLMGNHEDMLLANIDENHPDPQMGHYFYSNGGKATLDSYGIGPFDIMKMPENHIRWYKKLYLNWQDDRRYYVHAGIDPSYPLDRQTRSTRLWIREQFLFCDFPFAKYVVHGHTPVTYDSKSEHPLQPVIRHNRCNLDTGAVFGGKLTVAVFDDNQDEPINIIQDR